jgi:DNA-binding beta-propeller fold protein YncE
MLHSPAFLRAAIPAFLLVIQGFGQPREDLLPTGKKATPLAVSGVSLFPLNPGIRGLPDAQAGGGVTTAKSPDGKTLLVLTTGYNIFRPFGASAVSTDYLFVFDISQPEPRQVQVLSVATPFVGLAWNPSGAEFYIGGGRGDNVRVFSRGASGTFALAATIALGHGKGLNIDLPATAGVAVNAAGDLLVAANFENDSITTVDLRTRQRQADIDLRPGVADPALTEKPGGSYPYWVSVRGNTQAWVTSVRDREIVVVDLAARKVTRRIAINGQPNRSILNRSLTRLYVAVDNSDTVAVIDTEKGEVVETFETIAPSSVYPGRQRYRGANPNSLAFSPDEKTLYVTNGGTNSVAVARLGQGSAASEVVGLIPTAWYPNSVSVSDDGKRLYVVNGKSPAGPTTEASSGNDYVLQFTRSALATIPVPDDAALVKLADQAAKNNGFPGYGPRPDTWSTMLELRNRIKHVILVIKENRTYDQVLGDLEVGNGDASLTMFSEPITPNQHGLARRFVTLDNFLASGEVSGNGWQWSTAARATDIVEKTIPPNYASRGLSYDFEGTNRGVNVGLATVKERIAAYSGSPTDPNLLPGTNDVAAPDGPGGEVGGGYLWDAALRAHLTIRNYGCFVSARTGSRISTQPFADQVKQVVATKQALLDNTDEYFRGFDQNNADFYLFKEWEREFDQYVRDGNLPNLQFVRLPHNHTGSFTTALYGVNTPDTQVADNDYALGLLVEKVANSPYRSDTLIVSVEDDAQNGPDHMDAHRTIAFVAGPYVKQGAVISTAYNTVSLIRTIEDVLGIAPMNVYDAFTDPMADIFDLKKPEWTFTAIVPEVLRTTRLPLPARTASNSLPLTPEVLRYSKPRGTPKFWQKRLGRQNFEDWDDLDEEYNVELWKGLMGRAPYPRERSGKDLRENRR